MVWLGELMSDRRAYWQAYYAKNRERILERGRAYHAANAEHCNAVSRAYYAANKHALKLKRCGVIETPRPANLDNTVSPGEDVATAVANDGLFIPFGQPSPPPKG